MTTAVDALVSGDVRECLQAITLLDPMYINDTVDGKSLLLHAIEWTDSNDVFTRLLSKGICTSTLSPNGESPLNMAARVSACHIVELLIAHGAETRELTPAGDTVLHILIRRKDDAFFRAMEMIGTGLPGLVNRPNHKGATPLMLAVKQNRPDTVRHLAWVLKCVIPDTVLMTAVEGRLVDAATCLVLCGANIHAVRKNGDNVLSVAIQKRLPPQFIALLVSGGADEHRKGYLDVSAHDWLRLLEGGHPPATHQA